MSHAGIGGDEALRRMNEEAVAADGTLMLCPRCEGTGNEFYAMYRRCTNCGGGGVVDCEHDDEAPT